MSKDQKSVIQCYNPSKLKHQESWRVSTVLHSSSDYLGYSVAPFPNQALLWSLGHRTKPFSYCCEHDDSGLCSCCVRVKVAKDCHYSGGLRRMAEGGWWLNGAGEGLQDNVGGGSAKRTLCGTTVRVREDVRVMVWLQC